MLAPMLAVLLAALVGGCGNQLSALLPFGGPAPWSARFTNLAYAGVSDSQVLDLWLPHEPPDRTPLVIYIHAGAFATGDKADIGSKLQPMLDAGFAVASVNYRLSDEATFPAAAQDVKAAVRWLRANAAAYRLDPSRFAAWGDSAGGNLAALLGTTGDQVTVLDDASLDDARVSGAVEAVVDWYGPTDFLQMDAQAAASGSCARPLWHNPASSLKSKYLGAPVQSVPHLSAQSDPITYISTARRLPAFSIAHGDADCIVAHEQSQILAHALWAAGASTALTILPDTEHSDAAFHDRLLGPTIAWLKAVLGGTYGAPAPPAGNK